MPGERLQPLSWADLLHEGLNAQDVDQFIAREVAAREAALRAPGLRASNELSLPFRRSRSADSLPSCASRENSPPRRTRGLSQLRDELNALERSSCASCGTPRSPSHVQLPSSPPNMSPASSFLGYMDHATSPMRPYAGPFVGRTDHATSPMPSRTQSLLQAESPSNLHSKFAEREPRVVVLSREEELERQVERLQEELERVVQERGAEVLSLGRELDDAKILDAELEETRKQMGAACAAANAARRQLAGSALHWDAAYGDDAMAARDRAAQAELVADHAHYAVRSIENTCELLLAAREEVLSTSLVEVAILRQTVREIEQRENSSRMAAHSQLVESARLEKVLLDTTIAKEAEFAQSERSLSHSRAHVQELERLMDEQQEVHASLTADRAQQASAREEALDQEVTELREQCQSLLGERADLMSELSATLELVERLQTALAETESSNADLLSAESTLAHHELNRLENSFDELQMMLSDLIESHAVKVTMLGQDHTSIVFELVEIVNGLGNCLDAVPEKVYHVLGESAYGANAAASANELSAEIRAQLHSALAALPTTIDCADAVAKLQPLLLEASAAQVSLALQTVEHRLACAVDAEAIAAMEIEQHRADHLLVLAGERAAREVDASALGAVLQELDTFAKAAKIEFRATASGARILERELSSCERELADVTERCLRTENLCQRLQLELGVVTTSEEEQRLEAHSLKDELTAVRTEMRRLEEQAVEYGIKGESHEKAISKAKGGLREAKVLLAIMQREMFLSETSFTTEKVVAAAFKSSLSCADSEIEDAHAYIGAVDLGAQAALSAANVAATHAEDQATEARSWSARSYASDAVRAAVMRHGQQREEELLAMLEVRTDAAHRAVLDSMMRRQETAVLVREIKFQEEENVRIGTNLQELQTEVQFWRAEADQKRRASDESAFAKQLELQRQLAYLSHQLHDEDPEETRFFYSPYNERGMNTVSALGLRDHDSVSFKSFPRRGECRTQVSAIPSTSMESPPGSRERLTSRASEGRDYPPSQATGISPQGKAGLSEVLPSHQRASAFWAALQHDNTSAVSLAANASTSAMESTPATVNAVYSSSVDAYQRIHQGRPLDRHPVGEERLSYEALARRLAVSSSYLARASNATISASKRSNEFDETLYRAGGCPPSRSNNTLISSPGSCPRTP
ncbi:hypothetical protein AB1Y20_020532 [Prymnesium parvum]|uniref:Uncharacterized protein n=1 Tax=Prymnesium parvum TaxID=97485 RepID=A0AB34JXM3_PRYPA